MAKFTGTVTQTTTAPNTEMLNLVFTPGTSPGTGTITMTVMIAGKPDTKLATGAAAQALMDVQVSGVTARQVLRKMAKQFYDNAYAITSTVNTGDGIDESY